jgi:cytochrome c biogenesis protein CcmG, thiol:disulfide interchange protein DsbE
MTVCPVRIAGRRCLVALLTGLALLLSACGASGGALGFVASGPAVPMAPAGSLTPVSGDTFEGMLVGARGTPVVVNIWASWCGPCRVEAPLLQRASQRYGERVVFLGVDARDSEDDARAFLKRYGITYPNVVDAHEEITGRLGLRGFPTTYIFDRAGKVRASVVGGISEQVLAARVDEALKS